MGSQHRGYLDGLLVGLIAPPSEGVPVRKGAILPMNHDLATMPLDDFNIRIGYIIILVGPLSIIRIEMATSCLSGRRQLPLGPCAKLAHIYAVRTFPL